MLLPVTESRTSRICRAVARALLNALLWAAPILIALFIAYGPLIYWTSIAWWWPLLVGLVVFILWLDFGDAQTLTYGILSFTLILCVFFFGGSKTMGMAAVVYDPPGQEAVIENRNTLSFYPWWRMQNREIYRHVRHKEHFFFAGGNPVASDKTVLPNGEVADVSLEVEYSIPDEVILRHHSEGERLNYWGEISRTVEQTLVRVLQNPPERDALTDAIRSALKASLADLGYQITYLNISIRTESESTSTHFRDF